MARATKKPAKKAASALVATSVRLPPETKAALEKAAAADDRTFTSLVTKILHDWLKERELK
jgi:predicted transcriptional regulator